MFSIRIIALVAAAAIPASVLAQNEIERIPVVLPVGPIPAGSEFSFGIIGSNYTADPESTFYASNFYVTNSSGTVPLNDSVLTTQPGISGVYSPAFERAPWVTGGSEFTPLNETRYCTQRPAQANSSFSVDTASWTPANYDLHYQTIIWTGANGVELNFTDPNRVEICITAPYTNVTAETLTVIQVVAGNSNQDTATSQVASALTTLTPGTPRPNPVNDVNTNSDDGYTSGMPRPNPVQDVNTNTDEGYATAGVAKVASAPSATGAPAPPASPSAGAAFQIAGVSAAAIMGAALIAVIAVLA